MASKMSTLEDLYTDLLKDLYSAENQLIEALPKMAQAAKSPELAQGFRQHLEAAWADLKDRQDAYQEDDHHNEDLDEGRAGCSVSAEHVSHFSSQSAASCYGSTRQDRSYSDLEL